MATAILLKSIGLSAKLITRRSMMEFSKNMHYRYYRLNLHGSISMDAMNWTNRLQRGLCTTKMDGGKTTKMDGVKKKAEEKKRTESKVVDRRRGDESTSIVEQIFSDEPKTPTTVAEKVKETTKDVTYFGVIVVGAVAAGALFYMLFRELWSSKSPGGVYKNAFKLIRQNSEVSDALGEPIKAHGEPNRRGRRRHPVHLEFEQDGVNCMRMKFYVEGTQRKGSAHLEVREDETKTYQFRYLFVQLDGYPSQTIVIADNR